MIAVLAKQAGLSDTGPRKYAMLVEAERLATEHDLFASALGLAEERALRFQSPTWTSRLTLLERMKASAALEHVEAGVALAEDSFVQAVNHAEFDVAGDFLGRLEALVVEHGRRERERESQVRQYFAGGSQRRPGVRPPKPTDKELAKRVDAALVHGRKAAYAATLAACRRELADVRKRHAALGTHAASQPGTPESGEAGRYLCLDRFDWEAGSRYLELAGGPLAEIARRERLARRDERPATLAAVADEWWAMAATVDQQGTGNRSDAASLETHAAELYLEVVAKLEGLEKQIARQRVQVTRPPRILHAIDLDAASCESAGDAVQVYEAFLAQPRLVDAVQRAATAMLKCWQARAEDRFINNGGRWISTGELETLTDRSRKRLEHGIELIRLGQLDLAKEELDEASRLDPASPVADAVIAYVCTVVNNPVLAAEHFREATRRSPANGYLLSNLATSELMVSRFPDALVHYEMALERVPDPLIANNVGFALQKGDSAGMPDTVKSGFSDLYRRALSELGLDRKQVDALAWYRPSAAPQWRPEPSAAAPTQRNPASDTVANVTRIAAGTGFVVAPEIVVTNRRVIEGSTEIIVVDAARRRQRIAARVMASSQSPDLAILECRGLPNQPLTVASQVAGRGEDVLALGFQDASMLSLSMKNTRGTVVSAAAPERGGTFLHDCAVCIGDSGGPILDRFGRVVGVTRALMKVHDDGSRYGMGVPAQSLNWFLDRSLRPEVKPPPVGGGGAALPWAEVDARGSRSTVFVVALTRKGG